MDDLAAAIMGTSQRLGVDPVDLGTVISYETGGTLDPWQAGPTTRTGQHRGLIQWGQPEQAQYGVHQGMPNAEQMAAVEKYLRDRGVKPGMGLMDLYSAVNAGHVGLYNRSDAANGGAPGTVADKVNNQMAGHRERAAALLAGKRVPMMPQPAVETVPAQQEQIPIPAAPSGPPLAIMAAFSRPAAAPDASMPTPSPMGNLASLFVDQQQQPDDQGQAEAAFAAQQARRRALLTPQNIFA